VTTIEDIQLTDHFTLYDLTKTSMEKYQARNREVNPYQIGKLTELARLLEHVMFVLSTPLTITSAYRCQDLNNAVGSTDRSQHLLCEAADFIPGQQDMGSAFRTLWRDTKDKGANVGQLIYETAPRPGGYVSWLHISLGQPYRGIERCKQILRMENGKYTRLA
jgi:zinc D-Ala-D-Ala carboxypeptidase